jgi:hypothetical protein
MYHRIVPLEIVNLGHEDRSGDRLEDYDNIIESTSSVVCITKTVVFFGETDATGAILSGGKNKIVFLESVKEA